MDIKSPEEFKLLSLQSIVTLSFEEDWKPGLRSGFLVLGPQAQSDDALNPTLM